MRIFAFVAVVWITGLFVTLAFLAGATRMARYVEPKPSDDELEKDLEAAGELALEDVYGLEDLPPSVRHDRAYGAILERQVVRGLPGQRPRPAGLR